MFLTIILMTSTLMRGSSAMKKSAELQERPPMIFVTRSSEILSLDKPLQHGLQEKIANIWIKQAEKAVWEELFGENTQKTT
jgi:hypothetical protein